MVPFTNMMSCSVSAILLKFQGGKMKVVSLLHFMRSERGASMVEYAVALIVVTLVGAVIFAFGGNISTIINSSAGAF